MRKVFFLLIICISNTLATQAQQGYVKKKGRIGINGTVIKDG